MIFVDSNNEKMALMEYLHIKFSNNLKDKIEQVKQYFHSILLDKLRNLFVENFFQKNIYI